jgi:hypothetical protein
MNVLCLIAGILVLVEFGPQCFEHSGDQMSFAREMRDDSWWVSAILSLAGLGLIICVLAGVF